MNNIARAFLGNDVLKIEIKSNDQIVYKDAARLDKKEDVKRLLRNLELKGFINLKEILKIETEERWS